MKQPTKIDTDALPTFEQFSDAELLDAWTRDRFSDAFAVLMRRHGVMVMSVCRRKCRSHADADDAYQSTFLLLAKNSAKISRPECLAGWLHRVAHRVSLATYSRKLSGDEQMAEPAMTDDPLDEISKQHDANVLDEELALLPEHYRAALVMQIYEDCPLDRIAESFQITVGSLRGRLQRGKKMLARRLRRRGVVPVVAIAAVGSTCVSAADVAAAESALLSSLSQGTAPQLQIPDDLLTSLLHSGKRIMTPINTACGVLAAGAIIAVIMANGFAADHGGSTLQQQRPVSISAEPSPVIAQFEISSPSEPTSPPPAESIGASTPAVAAAENGSEGLTVVRKQYRPVVATGPLAESLKAMMDDPIELRFSGTLESLVEQLESQLSQPVILDQRVIEYAELSASTPIKYSERSEPLKTALRKLLSPLGLKATIETEGLVITADHSQLVHRDIGTDRWINVDDERMSKLDQQLSQTLPVTFIETPLVEAVSTVSQQLDLPIVIDQVSLEEIGLTGDEIVSADLNSLSAYDVISTILASHELTLTVKNNLATVMTVESADQSLLTRIYWLEGIGLGGDFDSMIQLIQTSIAPDAWEALGGPSTISVAPGNRPGIMVSSTFRIHRQIGQVIRALRENSFAPDIVTEEVEVPAPPQSIGGQTVPTNIGSGGFM